MPRNELAPQSTPPGPVTTSMRLTVSSGCVRPIHGDVAPRIEQRQAVAHEQHRLRDAAHHRQLDLVAERVVVDTSRGRWRAPR